MRAAWAGVMATANAAAQTDSSLRSLAIPPFLFHGARDHQYAFAVTEQQIARVDPHTFQLEAAAIIDDLATWTLILGIAAAAEHRKCQCLDLVGVAHIAVQHSARRLQVQRPR